MKRGTHTQARSSSVAFSTFEFSSCGLGNWKGIRLIPKVSLREQVEDENGEGAGCFNFTGKTGIEKEAIVFITSGQRISMKGCKICP